jgi:fructose-1,6-bisphosphatase/inositol monophosphatase family enzyme
MVHIFISYSRIDLSFAEQITTLLNQVYPDGAWYDQRIVGGTEWWKEILDHIRQADVFIYLLTQESIQSEYCNAEYNEAKRLNKFIIPVLVRARTQIPEEVKRLQIIDMSQGITLDNSTLLHAAINYYRDQPTAASTPADSGPPTPMPAVPSQKEELRRLQQRDLRLCDRIAQEYWHRLEQAAVTAVTAGGVAAMTYYRQQPQWPADLPRLHDSAKNPSTLADLRATATILQVIHPDVSLIARRLGCSLMYLGEETQYHEWFERTLSQDIFQGIFSSEDFFTPRNNTLRIILDGIDGTGSFVHGVPLFCSAIGILIEDQVRVSAIYDPIHHVVYSALLLGPYDNPDAQSQAWVWEVSAGNRVDLTRLSPDYVTPQRLKEEAIGVHLTRTNPDKLHEFLDIQSPYDESVLERLAKAAKDIYALNSGIVAMTNVARGALGGFVNNITNLWDVAAGEVLIRACGGKVTDFNGYPINYSAPRRTSVVAARNVALHGQIVQML